MQTVEKPSTVSVEELKPNPLVNGQHISSPSASTSGEQAANGDATSDTDSKNDTEVPPPDPAAGILSPFNLGPKKLSHIQINKVGIFAIIRINYADLFRTAQIALNCIFFAIKERGM